MADILLAEVLRAARVAWAVDGPALIACETDGYLRDDALRFQRSLERGYAIGWDLVLANRSLDALDRTRGIFNGPLFTSFAYPWPSEQSQPMIPIVQIDLGHVAALSGIDLGDSLLQLWQGMARMLVRVVPREALVDDAEPAPEDYGDAGFVCTYLTDCYEITAFDGPYLFGPLGLDAQLESYIGSFAATLALKTALTDLRDAVVDGRRRYRQANRLFGAFDGITIYPEDRPPALFSSDDDSILNTGDAGVFTLYYDQRVEGLAFSADFQCC